MWAGTRAATIHFSLRLVAAGLRIMARMRHDWTDLQVFLHACEAGSMTAAAERAHLTLAAVSARIRALEEQHGVVLLQRHARGVAPTAAGEVLARHARAIFAQLQRLQHELLHLPPADGARPLVLLANSAALARPIVTLLASHAPLLVRESASEASVEALRSGAADLAIVSDAVATRGLHTEALGPDPLVLVLPPEHPFRARENVRFAEALAEPWVSWGEQSALATHLALRALALGTRIAARVSYPRVEGVLELVERGMGVTVLPLAIVQGREGVTWVPLGDAWAQRGLVLCRREGVDARVEGLAGALRAGWPVSP